jgi:hypothetical protein
MSYREELYMQGFCCLRGEERTFKLSRMDFVWVVPDLRAERKRRLMYGRACGRPEYSGNDDEKQYFIRRDDMELWPCRNVVW